MKKYFISFILFLPNFVFAAPLNIDSIRESALKNYPAILSSYDKVEIAKANLTAAKSFRDINFSQSYKDKVKGYYDGSIYDTEISKELGVLNAKIFGGYRKSYDDFADYDGDMVTNSGGEFRSGIKLSLLQNRSIDQNRLGEILNNMNIAESQIELEKLKMQVLNDATKAYWNWFSSGKILKIYENLYKLSLERQKQLEVRSKNGDIAEIIVIENKKNLLKRQNLLTKIKQEFDLSSAYLALFHRNSSGEMLPVSSEQLPEIEMNLPEIPNQEVFNTQKSNALNIRPEIRLLEIDLAKQNNELKFAKNLIQPQLDLEAGVSKDQGNGPDDITQSNNYVNLSFSIPLQRREAKGKISAANAKLSAINNQKRLLQNQIVTEIEQTITKIKTISEIYKLLEQEVELAKILQIAEVEKFQNGTSDFFMVNLREQDLAETQAAIIEIYKDLKNSLADYQLVVFTNSEKS